MHSVHVAVRSNQPSVNEVIHDPTQQSLVVIVHFQVCLQNTEGIPN